MAKNLVWVQFGWNSSRQSFFKNLAPSVTRYHGQLSSCTISEKTNDPLLRKLSDGRTDRQTDRWADGQTDESDFIGRCPTNIERPTSFFERWESNFKILMNFYLTQCRLAMEKMWSQKFSWSVWKYCTDKFLFVQVLFPVIFSFIPVLYFLHIV